MGIRQSIGILLIMAIVGCNSAAENNESPQLVCETGPAQETFGDTDWMVYGCDEPGFLVAVSAENSPAGPSMIFLKQDGFDVHVSAEGSGDRNAAAPALDHLQGLSRAEFKALATRTGLARR